MKSPNEIPAAAEFGQLRAFLARLGVKQANINAALGATVRGRTRKQITDDLIGFAKPLTKAKGQNK